MIRIHIRNIALLAFSLGLMAQISNAHSSTSKIAGYKVHDTFVSNDPEHPGVLIFSEIVDDNGYQRKTVFWSPQTKVPDDLSERELSEVRLNLSALNGVNPQLKVQIDGTYDVRNTSASEYYSTFSGGTLSIKNAGLPFELQITPGSHESEILVSNFKIGGLLKLTRASSNHDSRKKHYREWLFGVVESTKGSFESFIVGKVFNSAFSWFDSSGNNLVGLKLNYSKVRALQNYLANQKPHNIATFNMSLAAPDDLEKALGTRMLIIIKDRNNPTASPTLIGFDEDNSLLEIRASPNLEMRKSIPHFEFQHPHNGTKIHANASALSAILSNPNHGTFTSEAPSFVVHGTVGSGVIKNTMFQVKLPAKRFDRPSTTQDVQGSLVENHWIESIFNGYPPPSELKSPSFLRMVKSHQVKICRLFYKEALGE